MITQHGSYHHGFTAARGSVEQHSLRGSDAHAREGFRVLERPGVEARFVSSQGRGEGGGGIGSPLDRFSQPLLGGRLSSNVRPSHLRPDHSPPDHLDHP